VKWYKKDQHFLIDKNILSRIIEYGQLKSSDTVLEIGAGFGNLTEKIASKAGKVIAVEIDPELSSSLSRLPNVEVINEDVLKIEFPPFNKVISNLPYSISSPVTFKLLKHKFDFGILMYQYEFARRMLALPDTEDYSRLSIAVQYFADVELLEVVPRSAFSAPPEVQSAIVKITPRPPPYKVKDEAFFMFFIKVVFSQRRKKLRNAITNNARLLGIEDPVRVLKNLPDDILNKRAEALTPEILAKLAEIIINEKI